MSSTTANNRYERGTGWEFTTRQEDFGRLPPGVNPIKSSIPMQYFRLSENPDQSFGLGVDYSERYGRPSVTAAVYKKNSQGVITLSLVYRTFKWTAAQLADQDTFSKKLAHWIQYSLHREPRGIYQTKETRSKASGDLATNSEDLYHYLVSKIQPGPQLIAELTAGPSAGRDDGWEQETLAGRDDGCGKTPWEEDNWSETMTLTSTDESNKSDI